MTTQGCQRAQTSKYWWTALMITQQQPREHNRCSVSMCWMIIIMASIYQAPCFRHCVLIVLLKYESISSSQWHTRVTMPPSFIKALDSRAPLGHYHISQQSYQKGLWFVQSCQKGLWFVPFHLPGHSCPISFAGISIVPDFQTLSCSRILSSAPLCLTP